MARRTAGTGDHAARTVGPRRCPQRAARPRDRAQPDRALSAPPGHFSVVICAYSQERWQRLRAAVASVRAQTLPAHEIIVVIDRNDELLRRAEAELDGVVVLENAHVGGLAGARRTGTERASQPLLAFIDDDAVADPDWLEQLARAYDDPRVLGVGGLVEPEWERERPRWLPPEFDWVVGCTYAGMAVEAGRIRNPIGANMSVRADVAARTGTFESSLGRTVKGDIARGTAEETEFSIRTAALHPGCYWAYRPQARVRHFVPVGRSTWSYFVHRCRVEGGGKAIVTRLAGMDDGLRSERAYTRSVLPRALWRELRAAALLRAGAIVMGLAITTEAYVRRRFLLALRSRYHRGR